MPEGCNERRPRGPAEAVASGAEGRVGTHEAGAGHTVTEPHGAGEAVGLLSGANLVAHDDGRILPAHDIATGGEFR